MPPVLYFAGKKETFNVVPSLEHITAIKIDTFLWCSAEVRVLINELRFCSSNRNEIQKKWEVVENKVKENALKFFLPEGLKTKVLNFIKPIGLEILKWKKLHEDQFSKDCHYDLDLPTELCWTAHGTIDKRKTADILVKDTSLDFILRFQLACIYCLETDIKDLWHEYKSKVLHSGDDQLRTGWESVVSFWTSIMNQVKVQDVKHGDIKYCNYIEKAKVRNIFKDAAFYSHLYAAEFLLQQLQPFKTQKLVLKCSEVALAGYYCYYGVSGNYSAEVIFFLLSQMNEEQQVRVLEKYASDVLLLFLEWPYQDFFIKVAKHLMEFIADYKYEGTLRCIVNKMMDGYEDYNYQSLFTQFWHQGHDFHKRYVIHQCASDWEPFGSLFYVGDKLNIQLILNDATLKEQEDIISYNEQNCKRLVTRSKYYVYRYKNISIHELWGNLLVFLKAVIGQNRKKRAVDVPEDNPSKKICSAVKKDSSDFF